MGAYYEVSWRRSLKQLALPLLMKSEIISLRNLSMVAAWTWWPSTSRGTGTTACPATTSTGRSAWAAGPTPGVTSGLQCYRSTSLTSSICTDRSTMWTFTLEAFWSNRTTTLWLVQFFKCIIGDQFARLKKGDRFFYDLGTDSNVMFSSEELREIRKSSLARLICDNSDVDRVQPFVLKLPISNTNALRSCDEETIPRLNLNVFNRNNSR